ncbi:capsular exopolysaccharide family [Flagellimonas flava]|uniref:non-specific protein-tyrosine kinase n=1 Tax=Flagellimonas flava TaxID=570519 RepID=A0A1M5J5P2_9FLAO|nr:capsular exopolysaccharide family [Allomuricauda flava]
MDYKALVKPYFKNWKWFLICVIIALSLGFLQIRYETPRYEIKSKIQILDDQTSNSELAAFKDLQFLSGGGGGEISDEIEILGSRANIIEIVKKLELNRSIIEVGNIRNTETYLNSPFNVNFLASDSIVNNTDTEFFISLKSDSSFEYASTEDGPLDIYPYGKPFNTAAGEVIVTPNLTSFDNLKDRTYRVSVKPLAMVAEIYQERIEIFVMDELSSNIITISLQDPIKQKGKDILNMMVANYNEGAIQDKKAIADRTSNFINDRIADIYGDLSTVDQSAEDFKAGRGIADISTQTSVNLNIGATSQQELQNASVQLDIASSMKDLIDGQNGYELLPANVGLADPTIATTTARFNDLALERKRLLESSNEKNPIIVNLDQQLDGLKRSMRSSLNSVTNNLALQVNSLSSQLSRINSRIYSAPRNERALRDITRQQQTTESLYLYLLQKREEAQITFASASPKSKIIDDAYLVSELPVSPKKPIIMLASLILGLLLPFSVIYIKNLVNNKVQNKIGLERLVGNIPVLAELPKIPRKENVLVKTNERTVLAESLRILRTNLDYILKSKKKTSDAGGNTIFITSSVPGEGKTLVASNLAMIYANTNKKVLLLGADIRNPKINRFYSDKNRNKLGKSSGNHELGLTDFLVDGNVESKDIITSMLSHNQAIDVIYSGKIPPNPAELLMSERMAELITYVRQRYDYIIVDTAPIMVVSDTLMISKYADQTLYVTRAGMTERKVIEFPLKLNEEGKLKNLSFIVNGVDETNLGYGGKYGYGYGKSVKKWWKFT